MIHMRIRLSQVVPFLLLLSLLLAPTPVVRADAYAGAGGPVPAMAPSGPAPQCSGYYYTVKLGDTWTKIARRVALSVGALQTANPQAVRARDVIFAGEKLCIPSAGGTTEGGYWYQVQPGDTWDTVARKTGVSVEKLWAANPRLVNKRLWLYIGQTVWVPVLPAGVTPELPPAAVPTPLETAVVAATSSAPVAAATSDASAAAPTSAPTATLLPTNTAVPPTMAPTATALPTNTAVPPTTAPTATALPTNTAVPPTALPTSTATVVQPPAATPTPIPALPTAGVPEPTSTSAVSAQSGSGTAVPPTVLPTVEPSATPTVVLPPRPADCPNSLSAYDAALAAYLNKAGNTPETLQNWLVLCRAVEPGARAVTVTPITGPKSPDVIVVVLDPAADTPLQKSSLLVFHKGAKGYALAHKHEGQGGMDVIRAVDINADGKPDIVYSDTTCGAHTCFGTLFVDSWDGKAYASWVTGEPTMAYPEYTIKDVSPDGQGSEILIHGGMIGSVGAGPQRAWTETYVSAKGAPYVLLSQVYDPSTCLYHKIVDANRMFDAWALDGFEPAIEAYKAAVADPAATACGEIKDEVATLRDFARFRLIVAEISAGRASESTALPAQITNPAISGAANTFVRSYKANTSVIQACRDTTRYALANPASWQYLADWGYANPSFTAQDLCPLN